MSATWKRLLAPLAALSLALAACGDSDDTQAAGTGGSVETTEAGTEGDAGATSTTAPLATGGDCATEEVVCIGLVTDVGKVDDKSFNQSSWEAIQQMAGELDAQADYIETTDATDYATNMGSFADQGYDIIVTSGFALGEATVAAAQRYPDIDFIGVDQPQGETPPPNLAGLIFPEDQAGFMAGALAGLLTESDTVASVLGTNLVPPVIAFAEGFEAGVQHTNPDADVITTYHPGGLDVAFVDPAWGADTARQAMDQGADVIFGAGGLTGNGALSEVAKEGGSVYCIGVDTDQWDTVPEAQPCLVSSAMKLITQGVAELIQLSVDGALPAGNYVGEVALAPYHDHGDHLPEEVKTQVQEVVDGVLAGEIQTS